MDPFLKRNIAVAGVVFLFAVAYVGNLLPLQKSTAFIASRRETGSVTSLQDLMKVLARPLEMYSPVGQPELARNTANFIYGVLQTDNGKNKEITRELVAFANKYYEPLVQKPGGMSFSQDILILGIMNEAAAVQTLEGGYADAAQILFERGLALSPRRPQFMHGLLDIYRMKGDLASAKRVAEEILSYWPDEVKTKEILGRLNQSLAAP